MRRMMLLLVGVGLLGMLTGCNIYHGHGVCDCEEFDYCTSRSPWVHGSTSAVPEALPMPASTPDAKKGM